MTEYEEDTKALKKAVRVLDAIHATTQCDNFEACGRRLNDDTKAPALS